MILHTRCTVSRSVRRDGLGIGGLGFILVIGMERWGRRHVRSFGGAGIRRVLLRRRRDLHLIGAPCEDEKDECQ